MSLGINLNRVAILGAGTMGRGIAQWFAQAGAEVELGDALPAAATQAQQQIHQSWDKLQAKGKFSQDQVLQFKSSLRIVDLLNEIPNYRQDCDLLIEAIVENPKIKNEVFQKLDAHFKEKTLFASNTSSIPINSMGKKLSPSRRERFLGLHFFNPAPIMKLVEIIQGHWTSSELTHQLHKWFEKKGKKPALCTDGPGFIVNRIARNFYGESLRLVNHYDQNLIQETDETLRQVGGFPMGPFELMDLIGIDINYSVTQSVWEAFYYDPRFAPHPLQRQMVESGRLGRKTKGGFYESS